MTTRLIIPLLLLIGILVIPITTLAAEPDAVTDAVTTLKTAKAELDARVAELQTEKAQLDGSVQETISQCEEVKSEYFLAVSRKTMAEVSLKTLEEVSKDKDIAERILPQLTAATALIDHEATAMVEILQRAEKIEVSQTTLVASRDEISANIAATNESLEKLDKAIKGLKAPSARVELTDDSPYSRSYERSRVRRAVPTAPDDNYWRWGSDSAPPAQIAACMVAEAKP